MDIYLGEVTPIPILGEQIPDSEDVVTQHILNEFYQQKIIKLIRQMITH